MAEGQEHGDADLAELGESAKLSSEKLTPVEHLEAVLHEKPKAKPVKRAVRTPGCGGRLLKEQRAKAAGNLEIRMSMPL